MHKRGNLGPKSAEKKQSTDYFQSSDKRNRGYQDFLALKIKLIVQVWRSVCSMIQLSQNQLIGQMPPKKLKKM
jgi:hypothetical protein